jgi:hypothetical protein
VSNHSNKSTTTCRRRCGTIAALVRRDTVSRPPDLNYRLLSHARPNFPRLLGCQGTLVLGGGHSDTHVGCHNQPDRNRTADVSQHPFAGRRRPTTKMPLHAPPRTTLPHPSGRTNPVKRDRRSDRCFVPGPRAGQAGSSKTARPKITANRDKHMGQARLGVRPDASARA